MNKLVLAFITSSIGVAGFALFYQRAGNSDAATAAVVRRWESATNDLAATQEAVSSLRAENQEKRERLRQVNRYPNFSPELLELLGENKFRGQAQAWAELRQQLDIGWDTSPDYVLVNKRAIRGVWFGKLINDGSLSDHCSLSDDAVKLLSFSPDEQKAVRAALAAAREGQWFSVTSTPPTGDIVAQYTIVPPDPAFAAGQSNAFAADITEAIGPERASIFLHDAWRELVHGVAPEAQTMIIRQTNVDGQPDLVCEETFGTNTNVLSMPVRYARYPAFPVRKLFPGGWQDMADALGFELPPSSSYRQ